MTPPLCTCPGGDGSLRWPCLRHPPEGTDITEMPSGNFLWRCAACVAYDPDATCRECRVLLPRAAS